MLADEEGTAKGQLKQMCAEEFVRRFKHEIQECDSSRFVFFIGAGCSISSGILSAKDLVKAWLPKLKYLKTGNENGFEEWARNEFIDYEEDLAAHYYGKVIEGLFGHPELRQSEIERLTEGKDPSFGYAVLAQLIGHKDYGSHCNAVLTVNFDDLIADALYLYTQKKPMVIVHDSLVGFVRRSRKRPLVLKLHGDARLEPKNTESETRELAENVKKVLKSFLDDAGLIFMGYGGHDESIANILKDLPNLPWGIYWVNTEIPEGPIGEWLRDRNATWVNHLDFDELMLLMWNEFGLSHPDNNRFTRLTDTYRTTFDKLKKKLESKPQDSTSKELSESLSKAVNEAGTSWWGALMEAEKYWSTDPDMAESRYIDMVNKFPNDIVLGGYALFLHEVRKKYDTAEKYYKDALNINPKEANNLGNYALFLWNIRKDYDKAEEYYKKSLEINPNNAIHLGNYALFLSDIRKDYDRAEEYYKKSLEANPNEANNLGNYAIFLQGIRKDCNRAEEYYKKSLEINPDNANFIGNYAGLMLAKGDNIGFDLLQRALDFNKDSPNEPLNLEILFYKFAHSDDNDLRRVSLSQIKALLKDGVRSPGWNLSPNVDRAIKDGHPCPGFLSELAKVISDEKDIESLDRFDAWTKGEGC